MEYKTEMYEADQETTDAVVTIVQFVTDYGLSEDKKRRDITKSMSIAIAIVVQSYLAMGGKADNGEVVGEMVKQGIITMLGACKDIKRINTNVGNGRLN